MVLGTPEAAKKAHDEEHSDRLLRGWIHGIPPPVSSTTAEHRHQEQYCGAIATRMHLPHGDWCLMKLAK